MKKNRTTEIIIETDEIFITRKSGEPLRALCEQCGREVELILTQPIRVIEDPQPDSPKGDSYAHDIS